MTKLNNLNRKDLLINGIYIIKNIKNNKFYIGSCSSKTFLYDRLKHHSLDLRKNKHVNKYLQNSFNKYGLENFVYEILEICLPEKCLEREQYWIDLLNPHYNLCKVAGSSLNKKTSEETKQKIKDSVKKWYSTEEGKIFKNKLSELSKKRPKVKHSEETKNKISKAHKGKTVSEESKNKMRCKRPSLYKKIIDLKTLIIYENSEIYSKLFQINQSYVQALARGERKSKKHNIKYYG